MTTFMILRVLRRRCKKAVAGLAAFLLAGCGLCNNCAVPAYQPTPTPAPCVVQPSSASDPSAVFLGSATAFAVLAGSAVNNNGATVINGQLGVSPGNTVTGFPPGVLNGAKHAGDAAAAQAQTDLTTAYNDAAGRSPTASVSGDLGGRTLGPGVYKSSSSMQILSSDLTLDGGGNSSSVFIFQIGSTLSVSPNRDVNLVNGTKPCKVFWQVGDSATIGAGSFFNGSILSNQSISIGTNTTMHGRALSRNGSVTLDTDAVSTP